MNKRELLKKVEFCILMQGKDGILGKAPSYIEEKYHTVNGSGALLDSSNQAIFKRWKTLWLREGEEDGI